MQAITFRAGDTIVREGDEGDTGFLITAESVEVVIGASCKIERCSRSDSYSCSIRFRFGSRKQRFCKRLIGEVGTRVGTLAAGEVFGEMCLIDPGPRSASVGALTDVECLETSYQEFLSRSRSARPKRSRS
jgi:CRP/FNR family transcriptional regulator, cyclic AMP receptor protein